MISDRVYISATTGSTDSEFCFLEIPAAGGQNCGSIVIDTSRGPV